MAVCESVARGYVTNERNAGKDSWLKPLLILLFPFGFKSFIAISIRACIEIYIVFNFHYLPAPSVFIYKFLNRNDF